MISVVQGSVEPLSPGARTARHRTGKGSESAVWRPIRNGYPVRRNYVWRGAGLEELRQRLDAEFKAGQP